MAITVYFVRHLISFDVSPEKTSRPDSDKANKERHQISLAQDDVGQGETAAGEPSALSEVPVDF